MDTRKLVLLLLLVPMLGLGFFALRQQAGQQALAGDLDPAAVTQIFLRHDEGELILHRARAAGDGPAVWEIASVGGAPADGAKVEALLQAVQSLEGAPSPENAAGLGRAPLELLLRGADGQALAEVAFWPQAAKRLPDGPVLTIGNAPALPVWASAWSTLKAPKILAGDIVKVERLSAGGVPLTDLQAAEVGQLLGHLNAQDFALGSEVNWSGATLLRVTLVDGQLIDVAQVADGAGGYFVRLASDTHEQVRAARQFAFKMAVPLP